MKLVKFNNRFPQSNNLMNHFFGSELLNGGNSLYWGNQHSTPKVNILETDNEFSIEVAAPGFDKKDFNVVIENDILTIEASKDQSKEDKQYSLYEFTYDSFKRSFSLPENKVKESTVSARYENGILYISLPKKEEAKAQPKRLIDIH